MNQQISTGPDFIRRHPIGSIKIIGDLLDNSNHAITCSPKFVITNHNMHIVLLEIQNLLKSPPQIYAVGLEPSLIIDCPLYKMPFLKLKVC